MGWKSLAKAVNRMAGTHQGNFWWKHNAARANRWLEKTDNATAVILQYYLGNGSAMTWASSGNKTEFFRKAGHFALGYIWGGELITPRDWSDENVAFTAGRVEDGTLVGINEPYFSEDKERIIRIFVPFFTALAQYDKQYLASCLLSDILRKVDNNEGDTETIERFYLPAIQSLAQEKAEIAAFIHTVFMRFSEYRDRKIDSISAYVEQVQDKINQRKKEQEKSKAGEKACSQGIHTWEFAGYEGVEYIGSIGAPTKITKIHMRCRYCGKPMPS